MPSPAHHVSPRCHGSGRRVGNDPVGTAWGFCVTTERSVVGWINWWKLSEQLDTTQGSRVRFSLRAFLLLFAAWALHLTLLSKMFADKLR